MCKILEVSIVNQKTILNCSEYEGSFTGARLLRIKSGADFIETKDFLLDKAPSCFSEHNAPWIMLTGKVDEHFLKAGNEIVLQ